MQSSELQKIANDICDIANAKFADQNFNNVDYKWILTTEGRLEYQQVDVVDNNVSSVIHSLKDYPAYIKLKEYIENIDCVKNIFSIDKSCYWTQPEQLLKKIIRASFLFSEWFFGSKLLLDELERIIAIISSGEHEITLIGRLHGVNLETDLIEITPDISLVGLDINAINQRQPFTTKPQHGIFDYSRSNIEIRIKDKCPIATSKKTYWDLLNDMQKKLNAKLKDVVNTIKLYRHGIFSVYPVSYNSSLTGNTGTTIPIIPMYIWNVVTLNDTDIDGLKKSFSIVKKISQDNVLERSLSRFLIGLDERVPEEQLVDFVIAWESILQTVNGQSNKSELSYRFSLNGASIFCIVDNSQQFIKMKKFMTKVYDFRSTIVHGGNVESILKDLNKLGYSHLTVLNEELVEIYRKTIFWLSDLDRKDRPYNKDSGWELLLPDAFKNRTQS